MAEATSSEILKAFQRRLLSAEEALDVEFRTTMRYGGVSTWKRKRLETHSDLARFRPLTLHVPVRLIRRRRPSCGWAMVSNAPSEAIHS